MSESDTLASSVREVTPRAIVLGILVGLVMSVANVYLGLFAGMTVSASIPAAVVSMGLLRGILKSGTIRENNIVQTIASAGESLAAGIIFTMPALVIAGVWSDFDFWVTTLVSVTGGMLGVLFMIPLRKPMIVEDKELTYPEGVACAKVLNAGEEGGAGMKLIFGALGVGALIKVAAEAVSLIAAEVKWKFALGKAHFFTGMLAAPALIGVGFIVGMNIGTLVFMGGVISWVLAGPVLTSIDYQGILVDSDPEAIYGAVKPQLRMLGVGAMIVAGLWSIYMIRNGIVRGVQETVGGYRSSMKSTVRPERTETDMEGKWILLLLAATGVVILGLYHHVTGAIGVSILAVIVILFILRRTPWSERFLITSLSLIVGGALGNLIDRIAYGWVIDFIDWHWYDSHWPTFNIADACISVGIACMAVDMIKKSFEKDPEAEAAKGDEREGADKDDEDDEKAKDKDKDKDKEA